MPDYVGDSVKLDVEQVWDVAAKNFPEMAGAYHRANNLVFQTDSGLPANDRSEFLPRWRALRDCLTTILGTSSRNIEDTATALREAMKAYAERDEEAADGLRAAMESLPDDVPELPPTRVPTLAPSPGYNPLVRGQAGNVDASYDGNAPTDLELLAKSKTTDDKLYEAAKKELSLLERGLVGALPDSWLGIDFNGEASLTDGGRAAPLVRVEALMQQAVRCNPAWYGPAIAALKSVGELNDGGDKPFNTFRTEVDNARDALDPDDRWDGEASVNFRKNFLNAYEDIAATQVQVVGTLLGALQGYRTALEDTYRRYDEAMDGTIEACQAIIDGQDGALKNLGTTVLSASISLAGGWATSSLKGATEIGFALAGNGLSVQSAASQVGGSKHAQVYVNLYEAIGNYRGSLEQFDQALARDLQSGTGKVQTLMDGRGEADIVLPRPAFADDYAQF